MWVRICVSEGVEKQRAVINGLRDTEEVYSLRLATSALPLTAQVTKKFPEQMVRYNFIQSLSF